jgi:hypothetical protein
VSTAVPAPRRRRPGRRLLIVVLIVLALLVILDRVGNAVAENQAAKLLKSSQHLDRTPSVRITGFPFLTQAITGRYGEIDVTVRDLTVGRSDTRLRIAHLRIALHGVQVARDFASARSDSATATAQIVYPDLSRALQTPVRYAGDGTIQLAHTTTVGGVPVPATATAGVLISAGALTFTAPQVMVGGQAVPPAVTAYFGAVFRTAVPLGGLPFGVRVRSVSADAAGLAIELSAVGLTYHR